MEKISTGKPPHLASPFAAPHPKVDQVGSPDISPVAIGTSFPHLVEKMLLKDPDFRVGLPQWVIFSVGSFALGKLVSLRS